MYVAHILYSSGFVFINLFVAAVQNSTSQWTDKIKMDIKTEEQERNFKGSSCSSTAYTQLSVYMLVMVIAQLIQLKRM